MNKLISISAIVISKNEMKNIRRCVESLAWCDEVVVIDDNSQDETVEIAASLGARVINHSFESFAGQRNWGLEHCGVRSDWVLMLDADEVSTSAFEKSVLEQINKAGEETVAFKTCRKTMFMGTWLKYSDGFPVWIMRIVKRERVWFEDSGHGEIPVPNVDGKMDSIREPFLHYPFSKGISDWVNRHLKYAEREARKELAEREARKELDEVLPVQLSDFWEKSETRRSALRSLSRKVPARFFLRFCYQYFWNWGFLDGRHGLVFCRLMAFYEGLIVLKKEELKLDSCGETP